MPAAITAPPGGLRRFIELFAGCGFAIAQPVFAVFGTAPEQFVFRGATSSEIIAFAVLVVAGPPLLLWCLEAVVGLASRRAQRLAHVGLLGLLAATFAVQVLRSVGSDIVPVLAALGAAVGFVGLYRRFPAVRMWIAYSSVAPLGFAALFLVSSDTARLLQATTTYDTRVEDPQPVVMLMLDELPLVTLLEEDATIDEHLFPNFAAFAEDSHWFRHTTSVSSTTIYAVPAMLSGILPSGDASAIAADHPDNLFTWLGDAYELDVTESVTRLCPTTLCEPLDIEGGGLSSLLDDAVTTMRTRVNPSATSGDITAGFVEPIAEHPEDDGETDIDRLLDDSEANHPARFAAMLERLEAVDPDEGSLTYAHVLLPHVPFRYTPDGTLYEEFDPGLGKYLGAWDVQPGYAELAHERHLLQALYADALLGDLLERLRDLDLYDDATVVVAADHGISFIPGKTSRATLSGGQLPLDVASQLMYVPFFVKESGQATGAVDDRNVWGVDLLPTIADIIGGDIPWDVDGVSAFGAPREEGPTSFFLNQFRRSGTTRGPVQESDTRELWPAALQHTIDQSFPGGSLVEDRWRPWRVGPRPELVGRPITDPELADATELDVRFDPRVDLDLPERRTTAPVLIRGFPIGVQAGDEVSVAVNGTVTSTTRVLADGSIVFVVDPTLYRTGSNDLRVHLLD